MPRAPTKRSRKAAKLDQSLSANFNITSAEATSAAPSIVTVDTVSHDHRRLYRSSVPLPGTPQGSTPGANTPSTSTIPLPGDALPRLDLEAFFLPDGDDGAARAVSNHEEEQEEEEEGGSHAPRYENSVSTSPVFLLLSIDQLPQDQPMSTWLPERDAFLDELNRREGRGNYRNDCCKSCPDPEHANAATIRCLTCVLGPLRCASCAVRDHASLPYHRVQVSALDYLRGCHMCSTSL